MRPRPAAIMLMAAMLAACSTDSGEHVQTGDRVELGGQQVVSHGETDIGGQTAEDIRTSDFYFEPTILRGSGGQSITLSISNPTSTLHNFTLPRAAINQELPPGQAVKVTVMLPPSGYLVFYCRYHRSQGMLGALEAG
ncbi:MAG: cupredoxin domain-containing protein [Actinomycetota bacterium]